MIFEVSDKCTPPFGRDLLIDAARQRARGLSWELIAEKTPHSAGELCRFAIKHPEAWRPLYVRAEKLRLQEAEGRTLAHLTALLKGKDETAAEQAARELLLHRRHIERRRKRYPPQRHRDTEGDEGLDAAGDSSNAGELLREMEEFSVPQCLCGENNPPEELETPILAAARGVALGEEPASIARETGRAAEEIARWAFIYAKAWDRAYWPARLEAAEFGAALAINRLLDFVAGPDAALAARAARTLLVHRRHMHWNSNRNRRCTQIGADLSLGRGEARPVMAAAPAAENHQRSSASICGSKFASWRLGGEKNYRSRDGP